MIGINEHRDITNIVINMENFNNLNINGIFDEAQSKLTENITLMFNEIQSENREYREWYDSIMKLPFIIKLVEENKLLHEKLSLHENKNISLEVVEKPSDSPTHRIISTDDGATMITVDNCDCELCDAVVDCNKHNIYIL